MLRTRGRLRIEPDGYAFPSPVMDNNRPGHYHCLPMSVPGQPLIVYHLAMAHTPKTEAAYFPILHVIPPTGNLSSPATPALLAKGNAICLKALKSLDPEVARMTITHIREPRIQYGGRISEDFEFIYQKAGWRVWADWAETVESGAA